MYDRLQTVGVCLSYDRTLDVMNIVGGHFNSQIIDIVKNQKRFRLVGDNINWNVGVHDQRLDHRSRMFHAFGSAVLVQNVSFDYLCDVAPQIHYSVAPVQLFIPSLEEISAIKEEYVAIVTKIAARHIPLFQLFKECVPKQLSRPVSEKLKEKTKVVPMPVLFKNEQYLQDVVQILDSYEVFLDEVFQEAGVTTDGVKVHIGGDQLTRDRFSGGKALRSHHIHASERFDHLGPITFELFHMLMNYMKMVYKQLYKESSTQDMGTLKSLKERLSRSSVGTNVNEHYDADKDFFMSVTDIHIVEMFLEYFGMDDEYSQPTKNQPPEFISDDERKEWLFRTVRSMLDEHIFSCTKPADDNEEELIGNPMLKFVEAV